MGKNYRYGRPLVHILRVGERPAFFEKGKSVVFKNNNCYYPEYFDDNDQDCAAYWGKENFDNDFCPSCKLFYVLILLRRDDPRIKKLEIYT